MKQGDVRERPGGTLRTDGPALDLLASKLLRPLVRPGTVRRSALVERLAAGGPQRIVSVVAPPGYGKTTLLSQWAERNGRAFAWVSVDEADNDPKTLLTYVANGTGPTSWPARQAPFCAGPELRRATPRPWSARYRPAQPSTGETSRQRGSSSSAPSVCGIC
jgi:hypothetical protein